MGQYIWYNLVALDQLLNTLTGGHPDETLSSRAWRSEVRGKILGSLFRPCIDKLFSPWEVDHCLKSYQSEMLRAQLPEAFRVAAPTP